MKRYWLMLGGGVTGLIIWLATDPLQISKVMMGHYHNHPNAPLSSNYDLIYIQQYPIRVLLLLLLLLLLCWSSVKIISFMKQCSESGESIKKYVLSFASLVGLFLMSYTFLHYIIGFSVIFLVLANSYINNI